MGRVGFLRQAWGRYFVYIPGAADKTAELFSWAALNRALEQHRLEPPRLRLEKERREVPPSSYMIPRPTRRGPTVQRVDVAGLYEQLRDGATLILDCVDEVWPPLGRVCEALSNALATHVQVNAYATWGTVVGFGVHWDDHDVIIAQISGRKLWRSFGFTRESPLYRDVQANDETPTTPKWQGEISAGDVLYIPRGCWHEAVGRGEPTLHLTFGINNPTGVNLLTWLADELRGEPAFRADLPAFADRFARLEHETLLRQRLTAAFREGIIDRFFSDQRERFTARPHVSLPSAGEGDGRVLRSGNLVRFSGMTKPTIVREADRVVLRGLGKEWEFALPAAPLLEILLKPGSEARVSALTSYEGVSPTAAMKLLEALVLGGLIHIVDE